jgi:acetyltransferase-like isoleucine patch superfamily enzyme
MGLIVGEITVEEGAWVGANSFIHPGVVIDQEAVVAAGSVVVKDVPMRSIVGGNPAQIIKSRQFRDLTSGEGGGFKQTGNLVSPAELSQRGNLPIK